MAEIVINNILVTKEMIPPYFPAAKNPKQDSHLSISYLIDGMQESMSVWSNRRGKNWFAILYSNREDIPNTELVDLIFTQLDKQSNLKTRDYKHFIPKDIAKRLLICKNVEEAPKFFLCDCNFEDTKEKQ